MAQVSKGRGIKQDAIRLLFNAYVYSLWQLRNRVFFSGSYAGSTLDDRRCLGTGACEVTNLPTQDAEWSRVRFSRTAMEDQYTTNHCHKGGV